MSFPFGTASPKTAASGFTLPANPIATPATGLTFGTGSGDNKIQAQTKPTSTVLPTATSSGITLNFGGAQAKPAGSTLTFGAPASTSTPSLSLGTTATVPASSSVPQFGFGSKATLATSTTASFTPILGSTVASSASSGAGLTLGASTVTSSAAAPTLLFGAPSAVTTATAPVPVGSTPSTLQTSTAVTSLTSTTSAIPATGQLSFAQLEDSINKWTIDLEEQGKFFINQAKQLNAWDSLLISNGEKILNLNGSIERVKQQQQQLDQELDFVLAQQKELEELIRPLEKELVDLPVTDIDRNQMYQFSEIIDSQLKQMSDDLKEIIEHINESNKDEEVSNPVTQISRILNAHMNSLQWIDRNTAQVSSHLEQISKMQDSNRRNFPLNHSLNHSYSM